MSFFGSLANAGKTFMDAAVEINLKQQKIIQKRYDDTLQCAKKMSYDELKSAYKSSGDSIERAAYANEVKSRRQILLNQLSLFFIMVKKHSQKQL